MTNDKDLFSQINDLFEDVTVDQASDLIGEKLTPKQSDYEKELIEKLNNNEFQLDDALVEEISNNIEKGGEVDRTLTQYLREKFGLAEPQAGQEYIVEDVLQAPQEEAEEDKPVAEDYIAQYADQLSGVIKKSQASQLRDRWAKSDDPQQRGDIYEKVEALTVQLNMLRSSLTEATMVSGIGQGGDGQTPGSGEVRINRMDDVCLGEDGIAGLKPGDVLVWDPDGRKGEGCWTPKPGDEIGTDTAAVFGKIWSCSELKEDGNLYWGTNSDYVTGVTTNLVRSGVRSIQYTLSIDYDDNGGTYTGVWVAFGAVGGGVDIIPAPSTTGTSGPNGPEGFYLLGAECAGSETTEPQVGTIHGCAEFEEAGGDLYWGTKDEMELGIGINIPTDGPVTKILEVVSTNADPVTRVGDWTCIYEYNDGNGNILQADATVVNQKDGPNDGGFYVLNAECIDPEYPDSERPKLGFISGCKETGDAEAPIKWGNKFQAENGTGDSVTTPDTMAKEIIAVVGKEVDDAGFGTWTCLYVDSKGDALSVDYEGTSSLVGPDGFYLETDNCASDVEEPISENNPLFGIISGCDQVNDGGSLRFGTNDDYLNDAGTEVAVNAKKIWSVFSLNADVDTKAGTWTCLYQDVDDNWLAVDSSPDNDKTSPDYGFFIKGTSCDGEEGPTDGRPSGLKFGPITGCRELVTPDGPLHWGTREEYEAGAGKNTGKRAARIIFNFSVNADDTNDGTWNCLYRDVAADLQVASELGQSPEYGFFISGNDCKEDGTIDGELGPVLGGSHGCVRVIPKGVLYWGTAEDADPDDTDNVGLKIDDDVTQIIGIIGTNLYDNLYGEWRCVYKKGAGSQALVSQVQLGTNPTDSYYLIADAGGQCVEDGFYPDGPDQNKPEYGQTIGCNESTSIGPLEESNLYWADNRSAAELGNGVKKTDTNDIKKILSVFSFEEADETTGDREWTCLYQTFGNDFGYVVHTGKSPDGGFYIDTPNCATDPDIDVPGDELEPNLKFGKPVGCPVTTDDGPGNLYWSNLIATTAGENGTQIDGDGDVLKLHFSFTLDPLLRSWNLFYEKEVGTAFVRYPTTVSGESFQSWPWGYHIADGTCAVDPNPEPEPPEGNGKPVFGIITGCKKMEDTIGTTQEGGQLYFGTVDDAENEDGSGSFGKVLNDVDGDPITNAVRIISVVSFNSDNTRYGTWTCIFKDAEGKTRLAATNGRSPQQGYYLFGNQCDDDGVPGEPISCEDTACPEGMQCIDGTCVLIPCSPDPLDPDNGICPPGLTCWQGMCFKPCTGAGDCPDGFECVEVSPGINLCVPPGFPIVPDLGCNGDNDCPEGFHCVSGNCVQLPCDKDGVCPNGMECVFGHCYKTCDPNDPDGCPEGFRCVEVSPGLSICVIGSWPPGGGSGGNCGIDTDCHNGYVCIDGTCVPDRCDDGTSCKPGFHCFEGVCYPICGPGLPDCPPGHICVNIGNGISICMPGGGAGCTEDNHCPPGFICDDGNCVPDRCDDGTSCRDGYICYNGVCYKPCLDGDCPPGYECVTPDPSVGPICMPTGGGGGGESELDDIYFGYLPGCKVTGDSGAALKFGDATVPAGDPIVNAIVDAKAIIFTFAIDDGTPNTSYDPSTGIGDWTCVYTNAAAQIKSTTQLNAGPSPEEGFYIDTTNCTDTDPDQPAPDPTRVDTIPIGCRESNPSSTLKWGTVQDTVDGTGTDIIDTDVEEIIYTGYENLYTNDYADQIVIYRKTGIKSLKTATIFRQNPLAGVDYGFYLDVVESGAECVFSGEEHNPYLGAIVGCREVSRDGEVYWGERIDYLNLIGDIDDTSTTPARKLGVRAKLIIAVVSTDADDTGLGNWDINYQTLDNQIGTVTVFGRSGNLGPQGAFILPTEDSVCLTEADDMVRKIYTDEVILRKIDNLNDDATTIRALRGGNPIGPFDHQDDANTVFSQEIAELNRRKPTMVVAEFTGDDDTEPDYSVEGVPQLYLPQTGDLWLDTGLDPDSGEPTYTLRAAIADRTNLDVNFPDRNDIVTEWKVISGAGGEGGANTTREVYLIRTVELYQNLQALKPDMTAEEFEAMFNLVTQEDLNILNAELLRDLQIKKPTIHVTDDIHQIPNYVPMTGDLWVNSINYRIYVCHRNEELIPGPRTPRPINDTSYVSWIELGAGGGGEGGGGNNIILSPNQPASAGRADLWIDENTYYVYVWQGSTWVALTGDLSAMGKQFKVHMGPEAPTGDELYVGKLWFDTEMSEMRVYYDNKTTGTSQNRVWIPVFNPGVDPQKIESDQTVRELQDQLQAMSARIALLEANNPGTGQYDNVSDDPSGINPYA